MAYGPINFLDHFLDPLAEILTPEVAKAILALKLDPAARARAEFLAERANEGLLSDDERVENEKYIEAADLMGIVRAKARLALSRRTA